MVRKKVGKKLAAILAGLMILVLFLLSPLSNYPVSLAVMKVYSGIHEKESIMAQKGITLEIPGGGITKEKDWYPFVMTFNDSVGFRRFLAEQPAQAVIGKGDAAGQAADSTAAAGDGASSTGRADYSGLDLTILYNFPAFDLLAGCSRLYDTASPYYNGFYGAYLVSGQVTEADGSRHPYGFTAEGKLDAAATAQVPQFDFQKLVLGDMGIDRSQLVFDWALTGTEEGVDFAESGGWTRADAVLTVNGVAHTKKEFHQSYLQYGPPGFTNGAADLEGTGTGAAGQGGAADLEGIGTAAEDFAPVDLFGRLYGKYLPEYDTSLFFYVLAKDPDVVERCSEEILCRSRVE